MSTGQHASTVTVGRVLGTSGAHRGPSSGVPMLPSLPLPHPGDARQADNSRRRGSASLSARTRHPQSRSARTGNRPASAVGAVGMVSGGGNPAQAPHRGDLAEVEAAVADAAAARPPPSPLVMDPPASAPHDSPRESPRFANFVGHTHMESSAVRSSGGPRELSSSLDAVQGTDRGSDRSSDKWGGYGAGSGVGGSEGGPEDSGGAARHDDAMTSSLHGWSMTHTTPRSASTGMPGCIDATSATPACKEREGVQASSRASGAGDSEGHTRQASHLAGWNTTPQTCDSAATCSTQASSDVSLVSASASPLSRQSSKASGSQQRQRRSGSKTKRGSRSHRKPTDGSTVVRVNLNRAGTLGEWVRMAMDDLPYRCFQTRKVKSANMFFFSTTREAEEFLPDLRRGQRINRFPHMDRMSHKRALGNALTRMQSVFPDEFTFFPATCVWCVRTCMRLQCHSFGVVPPCQVLPPKRSGKA